MISMNLEDICKRTVVVVKEVGDYIRNARLDGFEVEEKSVNSLVTKIDKTAEAKLIEALRKIVAIAGIIGEEGIADKPSDDLNWVIDPLDGTTNFIHGIPCFSISVALMSKSGPLVGVVFEINLDECFYAWKNGGAFLNGKAIACSFNPHLKDALIATGFPYYDYKQVDQYMALFRDFMEQTRGLRRLGSAAVDLAYVACGRFDAFYEYGLNAWDVAAGALIVEEAGGKVCDFSGNGEYIERKEIIASSANLAGPVLVLVQKHF